MTMPRFLDSSLIQEGETLVVIRTRATTLVHRSALDQDDEAMLMAMLGMDEESLLDQSVPLAAGFDDRALAARRRHTYNRSAKRSTGQ